MPIEDYYIVAGDDTELPTKINNALDYMDGKADDAVEAVSEYADRAEAAEDGATTQAGIATTQANNASTSADAAAASAATAEEISNISEVQTFTNPLARAVRVAMTAASSGSRGILVESSIEINPGDGAFAIFHEVADGGFTASGGIHYAFIAATGSSADLPNLNFILSGGNVTPRLFINAVTYAATQTIPLSEWNKGDKWAVVVNPQSASSTGSVTYYRNGAQFGDAVTIAAGSPHEFTGASLNIQGLSGGVRESGQWRETILYNRAPSSTEVLDLAINGPSPADIGTPGNRASQIPWSSPDFSSGEGGFSVGASFTATGNQDSIGGRDNCLLLECTTTGTSTTPRVNTPWGMNARKGENGRIVLSLYVPSSNSIVKGIRVCSSLASTSSFLSESTSFVVSSFDTWQEFDVTGVVSSASETLVIRTLNSSGGIETSDGDQIYISNNPEMYKTGITGLWSAEHAQSDTGQVLDQIHGNHALLPSSGATRIPQNLRPVIESPSDHSWTATNEIQYVAGNQALMSSDDSFLVIDVESDTAFDLNVGDGSDADRFVAAYTLSVGKNRLTIANPFNDGTNRKLTVQPASSVTASITVHAEMIKERI